MLALSHKNLKETEHRHRTKKRSSHTPVRQEGQVADPWAAIGSLALRPSLPKEVRNHHTWGNGPPTYSKYSAAGVVLKLSLRPEPSLELPK